MPEMNEFGQPIGPALPGWTPRESPAPARLEGRWCTLVQLADTGRDALYRALVLDAPPALWTYMARGPFADRAAFDEHLDAGGAPFHTLVVHAPEPVGIASYLAITPAHGSVEVGGIVFGPTLQRTPAATEAIHLMLAHAFDDLGYRRFEWKCDSLNAPSRRAAGRFGFRYEGRFRNAVVYKGRSRDTDWFSITDVEWPAVRAAHRQWLAPENFAPDGQQLTALRDLTDLLSPTLPA